MTPHDSTIEIAEDDVRASRAGASRRNHIFILSASVAVVVLAYSLVVVDEGRVAFRGLEDRPLPHSCTARMMFGIGCPGCGLTRGTILFANGQFTESFAMHPLAWIFAVSILVQIPYRSLCLARPEVAPIGHRCSRIIMWTLVVLMVGNWLLGFLLK